MGATTIWERWDGQKTDSTFQDPGMNSFNHYAYGAIGDWMYRVSAGIETKTPGYRNLLIQPHVSEKLSLSKATFESAYGKVVSGWERKDGKVYFNIEIPANANATIVLPTDSAEKVKENSLPVAQNKNLNNIHMAGKDLLIDAGSGIYVFEIIE
jgi:alpha-L-rhamnosidase